MVHETNLRVRYAEVDRMGVVHHSHYLAYFEVGRTEFLRSLGRSYRDVEDGGLLLVVADVGLRFLKPAGYDDLLTIRSRLAGLTGVRLRFEYEVVRPGDGARIATGHTTLAATDADGRPRRIPADFRTLLEGVAQPPTPAEPAVAATRRLPSSEVAPPLAVSGNPPVGGKSATSGGVQGGVR